MPERSLAYNPQFDIDSANTLKSSRPLISLEEYRRRKSQREIRTLHNLETALGERFNVEISRTTYELKDGKIQSLEHDETFEEIIRRGVEYRKHHGNPIDHNREEAELLGFTRVQEILNSPDFQGKVIIISPPGSKKSSYQQNFFDVWEKNADGSILMSRFTSRLSYKEYKDVAIALDENFPIPINLSDDQFIKHPISTTKTIEEILSIFEPQMDTISEQELAKIFEDCTPLILNYLNSPSHQAYNAILVGADKRVFNPEKFVSIITSTISPQEIQQVAHQLAQEPVRLVMTGCGSQGGFSLISSKENISSTIKSPFSVAYFGNSQEDHSDFPCPNCGYIIKYGAGIEECPGCDLEATCA